MAKNVAQRFALTIPAGNRISHHLPWDVGPSCGGLEWSVVVLEGLTVDIKVSALLSAAAPKAPKERSPKAKAAPQADRKVLVLNEAKNSRCLPGSFEPSSNEQLTTLTEESAQPLEVAELVFDFNNTFSWFNSKQVEIVIAPLGPPPSRVRRLPPLPPLEKPPRGCCSETERSLVCWDMPDMREAGQFRKELAFAAESDCLKAQLNSWLAGAHVEVQRGEPAEWFEDLCRQAESLMRLCDRRVAEAHGATSAAIEEEKAEAQRLMREAEEAEARRAEEERLAEAAEEAAVDGDAEDERLAAEALECARAAAQEVAAAGQDANELTAEEVQLIRDRKAAALAQEAEEQRLRQEAEAEAAEASEKAAAAQREAAEQERLAREEAEAAQKAEEERLLREETEAAEASRREAAEAAQREAAEAAEAAAAAARREEERLAHEAAEAEAAQKAEEERLAREAAEAAEAAQKAEEERLAREAAEAAEVAQAARLAEEERLAQEAALREEEAQRAREEEAAAAALRAEEEDRLAREAEEAAATEEAQADDVEEAPLPDGWDSAVDPGSGKTYYFNQATGETLWERPEADGGDRAAHASPGGAAQDELPPGWGSAVDPGSGKTYYYNVSTGETLWEPPQAEKGGGSATPAAQQLPAGWESAVDAGTGNTYYFNRNTGETLWEPPDGATGADKESDNGWGDEGFESLDDEEEPAAKGKKGD